MQTFLPYESFVRSAAVLDARRLGKQRVEVYQILGVLSQGPRCLYSRTDKRYISGPVPIRIPNNHSLRCTPWYNHPAVAMWRGYESWLAFYGVVICDEWDRRGFSDTCKAKIIERVQVIEGANVILEVMGGAGHTVDRPTKPPWLGDEQFHASHRSNLLRKYSEHYSQFGWTEPATLPYVWPQPAM